MSGICQDALLARWGWPLSPESQPPKWDSPPVTSPSEQLLETPEAANGRDASLVTKVVLYQTGRGWDWDAYADEVIIIIPARVAKSEEEATEMIRRVFGNVIVERDEPRI